jgi:hypothetical protein
MKAEQQGARYEIAIDGTPRTYRDREDYAREAAALLKIKQPGSPWRTKRSSVNTPSVSDLFSSPSCLTQIKAKDAGARNILEPWVIVHSLWR